MVEKFQAAKKAWVAATVALIMAWITVKLGITIPGEFGDVATTALMSAIAWVTVYFTSNKKTDDADAPPAA